MDPSASSSPNSPQNPGKQGLGAVWGCLLAGAAVAMALYFLPWLGLFKAVIAAVAYAPGALISVAAGVLAALVCLSGKRVFKTGSIADWAAGWTFGFALVLIALTGFTWLMLCDRAPRQQDYVRLMGAPLQDWSVDDIHGRVAHRLYNEGHANVWFSQDDCQALARWTPEPKFFVLTINGQAPVPSSCKRGLNTLEWSARPTPGV